ncbi:hypothetical protein JCM3775_001903 [Rhodotorula graminis]
MEDDALAPSSASPRASEHGDELLPPPPAPLTTLSGRAFKVPNKIACLGCRTIKVKCRLPDGSAPSGDLDKDEGKCARCIRLKLPCEYKSAPRRGRKPKDRSLGTGAGAAPPSSSAAAPPFLPTSASLPDPHPVSRAMYSLPPPSGVASDPSAHVHALPSFPSSSTASTSSVPLPPTWPLPPPPLPSAPLASPHLGYPHTSPFGSYAQPSLAPQPPSWPAPRASQAHSSPALSAHAQPSPASLAGSTTEPAQTMLSLAEAADVKSSSFTSNRPSLLHGLGKGKKPAPKMPDPVDMHVLTALEAEQLFQLFHTQLNCFIVLFDAHLHTADYVRTTSTVLFTAILTASAKFFRPDLYPQLLASAQQLVTRAMGGDGDPEIGLLQSLLILTYWKEPFDTSAWLRVGYAIRLGYQLGLHHKRRHPLPENEHEARVMLDRERTWIVLICNDNSYKLEDSTYETRMIPSPDVDIDAWLEETRRYNVRDDNEQAVSISLVQIYPLFRTIASAPTRSVASSLASHIDGLLAEMHSKYLDPSSRVYQSFTPACAHKARFHWRSARFELAMACLLVAGVSDQLVLVNFMARASDLVECFEEAVREGILRYMQDTIAVRMLAAGECLGKVFSQASPSLQASIVGYISRIYVAASRAKEGNEDSAPAFIARLYKAVLRALHPAGVPPTRPASPGSSAQQGESALGVFQQLDGLQSEIWTGLDSLVADLNRDNQYWDSLNSAQTNSSWAWLDSMLLQPPQDGAGAPS